MLYSASSSDKRFTLFRTISSLVILASTLLITSCDRDAQSVKVQETADSETETALRISRSEIQARIADLHDILTPNGVNELKTVNLGGVEQWISIRGQDKNNPVLLMIHGGPGYPMMPTSWAFQKPIEDYFTVVQWDQRGVGKNYNETALDELRPTMTITQHVQDAEELATKMRDRFGKEKIFALGYSWGSHVGLLLAKNRPDLLHAYIGVGQSIPDYASEAFPVVERFIYDRVMDIAKERNDAEALKALSEIEPYPNPDPKLNMRGARLLRQWVNRYNGGWYGRENFDLLRNLNTWSPDYTDANLEHFNKGLEFALDTVGAKLLEATVENFEGRYSTNIFFFMGRHDLTTPYEPARAFFDVLDASNKKFVTFEYSAHFPMFAEPGRFNKTLIDELYAILPEELSSQ